MGGKPSAHARTKQRSNEATKELELLGLVVVVVVDDVDD